MDSRHMDKHVRVYSSPNYNSTSRISLGITHLQNDYLLFVYTIRLFIHYKP